MVSTHLKNISQNRNLPQIAVKIKHVWNHHLDNHCFSGASASRHIVLVYFPLSRNNQSKHMSERKNIWNTQRHNMSHVFKDTWLDKPKLGCFIDQCYLFFRRMCLAKSKIEKLRRSKTPELQNDSLIAGPSLQLHQLTNHRSLKVNGWNLKITQLKRIIIWTKPPFSRVSW